MIGSEYDRRL